MDDEYFVKMLHHLRLHEEVVLYGSISIPAPQEDKAALHFLSEEYEIEAYGFPYHAPAFDPQAALWAAKVMYTAAQLLLFRNHKDSELVTLFPEMPENSNASSILSADICLRFLPDILNALKTIDADDTLINLLETILYKWHYSGINYPLKIEQLDFEIICADPSMHQLYANRIFDYKNTQLALHTAFKGLIIGGMGMFGSDYWKDLNPVIQSHGTD